MLELLDSFYPAVVFGDFESGGLTVTIFWLTVAIVIMLAVLFGYKRCMKGKLVPHGVFANGVEYIIQFVRDDICKSALGDSWRKHFPFLATLFFFVMFGNYVGMLPFWKAGTGSMGVTAAAALMSFIYFIYVGVRSKGALGYVKSLAPSGLPVWVTPIVWLIEVFSTFLRLVTLAVRLFCNMFAGHVVMGVFALMVTIFVQPLLAELTAVNVGVAGMSILWMILLILIYAVELLVCFIQAYIFALLSAVYVQLAEAQAH